MEEHNGKAVILMVIIFVLLAYGMYNYAHLDDEVAPRATIKEKVLSYPYRDNSPTLKAAEAKVVKKIDKVIQQWNSSCAVNGKDCGFLIYSSWIECGHVERR